MKKVTYKKITKDDVQIQWISAKSFFIGVGHRVLARIDRDDVDEMDKLCFDIVGKLANKRPTLASSDKGHSWTVTPYSARTAPYTYGLSVIKYDADEVYRPEFDKVQSFNKNLNSIINDIVKEVVDRVTLDYENDLIAIDNKSYNFATRDFKWLDPKTNEIVDEIPKEFIERYEVNVSL